MVQKFKKLGELLERVGLRLVSDWYELTRFTPADNSRFPQ
jgi:hypothetical protein